MGVQTLTEGDGTSGACVGATWMGDRREKQDLDSRTSPVPSRGLHDVYLVGGGRGREKEKVFVLSANISPCDPFLNSLE